MGIHHASGFLESPRLDSLGHYVDDDEAQRVELLEAAQGPDCFCTIPGNQIKRSSCTDQA